MADNIHASKPFTLNASFLISLAICFSLMPAAQLLATIVLPAKTTPSKLRFLFLWHAFDSLTHLFIEGAYLFHCFFSYTQLAPTTSDFPHPAVPRAGTGARAVLFNHRDRRYGPLYSTAPMARMWQEYAKADRRWNGADPTVVSVEILTVGLAGPASLYICYLIAKVASASSSSSSSPAGNGKLKAATLQARMYFLAAMLATGELYGGFVTFGPEWLSGNTNLQLDDPVYLWLHLVFFNVIWVLVPLWVLWEAWSELTGVFDPAGQMTGWKKGK